MTTLDRRIERAEELAREYPAAAEMLRYYIEHGSNAGAERVPTSGVAPFACPQCSAAPFLAILRPAAEGAARSLLCPHCLTEWPLNRLLCPACGEQDHAKLPVYTAEQFPHIRVDACDTCRTYLKTIDLTRNGLAVPEVDDLASIALDLWAQGQGYARSQPNILGM